MSGKLVALIARHGQTVGNLQNLFRSWRDYPLDDTGISQAHKQAKYLAKAKIKRVVSSPLVRALHTAEIIASPHKLPVYQHRGLLPWNLGVFSGIDREENNDALRLFVENYGVKVPGGQSLEEFEGEKFLFFKNDLSLAHETGLTLYVSHTSVVIALVNCTDGARNAEPEMGGETVKPGGIAAIYWDGKRHKVEPVFGGEEEAVFGGS